MDENWPLDIFKDDLQNLKQNYLQAWDLELMVADKEGHLEEPAYPCPKANCQECRSLRRRIMAEALRWGEPTITLCPQQRFVWGLPLMVNSRILGGLIACVAEEQIFSEINPSLDISLAARDLLNRCEEANLVNSELLRANRQYNQYEQSRAEAIHDYKQRGISGLRDMYSETEPELLLALRQGDKAEARGHINKLLTAILYQAGERMEFIKGLIMELVITMYRTALELGGEVDSLLGQNYSVLVELSRIESEEELSRWLSNVLDNLMDSIHRHSPSSPSFQLYLASQYMQNHFAEDINRADVARVAGMSPSHFSREFKKHHSISFSDYLNRLRIDQACELLMRSEQKISEIAQQVGFSDQSYLTNVFRRQLGLTPLQYRRKNS